MKVLIEAQSPLVNFSQLQPGTVFRSMNQEGVYMVCFESDAAPENYLRPNAVNLKTGELAIFGDVPVERVHAVLHIK